MDREWERQREREMDKESDQKHEEWTEGGLYKKSEGSKEGRRDR